MFQRASKVVSDWKTLSVLWWFIDLDLLKDHSSASDNTFSQTAQKKKNMPPFRWFQSTRKGSVFSLSSQFHVKNLPGPKIRTWKSGTTHNTACSVWYWHPQGAARSWAAVARFIAGESSITLDCGKRIKASDGRRGCCFHWLDKDKRLKETNWWSSDSMMRKNLNWHHWDEPG